MDPVPSDDAMRVVVVGCGYVGLVTAVGLAQVGHRVVGVEVDGERRARIAAGQPPFHEPGLEPLLSAALADGRFVVTDDLEVTADADVVLLAVQTPPAPDGSNDLSYLAAAAEALDRVFSAHPARQRVVAVRSTVVPTTTEQVVTPRLRAGRHGDADLVAVASNPEFLAEGSAVDDFLRPDRIVVGCHEAWGLAQLERLYAPLDAPVIKTTPATAELIKYTSNAFLATLISFSNQMAQIAETLPGVDVEEVLTTLHLDRRLQPEVDGRRVAPAILSYLKAGCGYGGSCLPKDLSALIAQRHEHGEPAPLLEAVREVNRGQPGRLVDLARQTLGGLSGRTVALLGLAFKAGTDDVRESPALRVLDLLLDDGAAVVAYDPLVRADQIGAWTARGVKVADSLDAALQGADIVLVATLDPAFAAALENRDGLPPIVDGRRGLRPEAFADDAFVAIGRGTPRTPVASPSVP